MLNTLTATNFTGLFEAAADIQQGIAVTVDSAGRVVPVSDSTQPTIGLCWIEAKKDSKVALLLPPAIIETDVFTDTPTLTAGSVVIVDNKGKLTGLPATPSGKEYYVGVCLAKSDGKITVMLK